MLGNVIGNFRVVSLLGRGGMGEVYVAEHVGIQTRVAVKVLLPEISKHADHVHRLFNEARIVSRIKHAGIAKIFDVGFHDGQAYLVMEFLEGEALGARIARQGRLSIGELADFGRQVASVLAATHASGVTHRDLKPDNIFVVPDDELERRERVKVLDFGIAKLPGSGSRTVGTMGTPEYMAPEQWGDSGSVDWRADAYSLGCVLFEMAAGRPPFPSSTIAEAYTQHTQSAPPSLRSFAPETPAEIDLLIQQLLSKDPRARCESMLAVARTLERWVAGTGSSFVLPDRGPTGSRAVTTLGGGAGQVGRVDTVKRTGVLAGAGALAAIVMIAILSGQTRRTPISAAARTEPAPVAPVVPSAHVDTQPPATPVVHTAPAPVPTQPPAVVQAAPAAPAASPPSVRRPKKTAPTKAPPKPAPAPTPAKAPVDELEGRT
ncbi:MAG: serine/threonine-protein kinase [Kofleriaceae bacterium]